MRAHTMILVALALCLGLTSALNGQDLRPGSFVRLQTHQMPEVTGRVDRLTPDSLWLRTNGSVEPIAFASLRRVEQRRRATRGESGWRWAKRGFVLGALLGGVTCLSDQDNCRINGSDDGLAEGFLSATLFFGVGVGSIGFAGGAAFPGHRWVEVPLPERGFR